MAVQCLYSTGISTCKISVLLMYNRIFGRASRRFRYALIATGCFVIAYNFIQFIIIIFQCQPINAAWNPNKCIKLMLELEIAGGFNALTDLITLILPLPILYRTQMPPKKKAQVIGTFMLGGFVTIVSFCRIPFQAGISLVDASCMSFPSLPPSLLLHPLHTNLCNQQTPTSPPATGPTSRS